MSDRVDATPKAADSERIAIVAELKRHVDNFDYMPADVQRSLIDGAMSARRSRPNGNGANRGALVQARYAELLQQNGLDVQHPETWGQREYEVRYRCMEQAEAEVPGAAGPEPVVEFVGDPVQALAQARDDHSSAVGIHARARLAVERGTTLLAAVEVELEAFRDLPEQIAEATAQSLRDGDGSDELPWALEEAARDRSKAMDRADRAKAALQRLQSELRLAQANLGLAEKSLRQAATRCVYADAEHLVEKLSEAEAMWLEHAELLWAVANANLDNTTPLPHAIVAVVNRPLPTPERKQAHIDEWRRRHRELLDA